MAEQTGQHGYLFKFDKVNATALHMLLQLHLGMKKNQNKRVNRGSKGMLKCLASGNFHTPRNPRDHEGSLEVLLVLSRSS